MQDMLEGDEDLLRRYLLGEATPDEEESLEQRLLEDDRLFEHARIVEGDLLAEDARGELTPAQHGRLRRWSASGGGRTRMALAQGLATIARERPGATVHPFLKPAPAPAPRWYRSAAALAASLLLFVGVPLAYWMAQMNGDEAPRIVHNIERAPSPSPPPAPDRAPAPSPEQPAPDRAPEPERLPEVRVPEQVVTQVLALAFTEVTRSGEPEGAQEEPRIIRRETDVASFELELDEEGEGPYEVTLRAEGDEDVVEKKRGLRPESLASGNRGIRFQVPADELSTGPYEITVQNTGAADSMPLIKLFSIRKQ